MNRYVLRLTVLGLVLAMGNPTALGQNQPLAERIGKSLPDTRGKNYLGPDWEKLQPLLDRVLAGGPDQVVAVVNLLPEVVSGKDFKPGYFLHALTVYVQSPQRKVQRQMYGKALASTLGGDRDKRVQAIVIRELQSLRFAGAVTALGGLLIDDQLGPPAASALTAIGGSDAAGQLAKSWPKAKGAARLAILRGLGEIGSGAPAVGILTEALTDDDRDIRIVAAHGLAQLADPSATEAMVKATAAEGLLEHAEVVAAFLRFARQLALKGHRDQAVRAYEHAWTKLTRPFDRNHRCAALIGWARIDPAGSRKALLKAWASSDAQLWQTAARAMAARPAEELATWWDEVKDAEPNRRAAWLRIVVARHPSGATTPLALAGIRHARANKVKNIAPLLNAAAQIDAPAVADALIDMLDGDASAVVQNALGSMTVPSLNDRLAKSYEGFSDAGKAAALDVLANRGALQHVDLAVAGAKADDPNLRKAGLRALGLLGNAHHVSMLLDALLAVEDGDAGAAAGQALVDLGQRMPDRDKLARTLIAVMADRPQPARRAVLAVLTKIHCRASLEALKAHTADRDEQLRDTAIRGLTDWPSRDALGALLKLAESVDQTKYHVLAIRGIGRLLGDRDWRGDGKRKLEVALGALKITRRADEKRIMLAVISRIPLAESIAPIRQALGEPGTREEAGVAAVRLCDAYHRSRSPQKPLAQLRALMEQVIETCENQRTVAGAKGVLKRLNDDPAKARTGN